MKWFDRKFSFNHLEGTFPGILERLKGTPVRLRYMIKTIPPGHYCKSPDGSWTIQEQVGHLGDLESLWKARFVDFMKGREVLTEADLTNAKTHQANHNNNQMEALLDGFENQRNNLCEFLNSFISNADRWYSRHPRLMTPMRPIDLAFFVAEHDDHHLARITKIHKLLSES